MSTVYAGPDAEETKTETESSADDIKVAIREMRDFGRIVQIPDEKGHLLVEAMTHGMDDRGREVPIVKYFILRVRHDGELDRSRKIDGYAVWKLLSNHDYQITSK